MSDQLSGNSSTSQSSHEVSGEQQPTIHAVHNAADTANRSSDDGEHKERDRSQSSGQILLPTMPAFEQLSIPGMSQVLLEHGCSGVVSNRNDGKAKWASHYADCHCRNTVPCTALPDNYQRTGRGGRQAECPALSRPSASVRADTESVFRSQSSSGVSSHQLGAVVRSQPVSVPMLNRQTVKHSTKQPYIVVSDSDSDEEVPVSRSGSGSLVQVAAKNYLRLSALEFEYQHMLNNGDWAAYRVSSITPEEMPNPAHRTEATLHCHIIQLMCQFAETDVNALIVCELSWRRMMQYARMSQGAPYGAVEYLLPPVVRSGGIMNRMHPESLKRVLKEGEIYAKLSSFASKSGDYTGKRFADNDNGKNGGGGKSWGKKKKNRAGTGDNKATSDGQPVSARK